MSIRRALITGASGLLGSNLAMALSERWEVTLTCLSHSVHLDHCRTLQMDITKEEKTRHLFESFAPHVVFHCAAETRVDYCEENPEQAFAINCTGTANVASAAASVGAKLVHISTGAVFDGLDGRYCETARPNPVNTYGKSKLCAERAVTDLIHDHLIIRSDIYGWNAQPKLSLAEWMLDRLERGEQVPGFRDIYFSPISVNDLIDVLLELIDADLRGTYHVAAPERCSKFEFALMVAATFRVDPALVRPSSSFEVASRAARPRDTSLDTSKVTEALNLRIPGVLEGLQRFYRLRELSYLSRLRAMYCL